MAGKAGLSRKALATAASAALAISTIVVSDAHAETTREQILREGKITIGISNGAPWGYRDQNGEPAGFHPDLIEAAFSELGVTEVDLVVTEFGALIPGLMANRFDAIAAGLYITPERCKLVAFSDPDLRLADAAVVRTGNPKNIHSYADIAENADIILGAGRGSVTAKNAAAAGVPEDRMLLFPDTQANVSAVLSGRIDAAAFSAPTVIRILADPSIDGLERALPFTGHIEEDGKERSGYSAIAFRLDDTDLRDAYNVRLAEMKADGTVARIMDTYGFSEQETAPDLTDQQICNGDG